MNSNKALEMALRIVNTCKKNEDKCTQCPFNIMGCIVSGGDDIPSLWLINDIIAMGIKLQKEQNK